MPALADMTTERIAVLEGIQIGSEAANAIGTPVAASERLRSMKFDWKQDGNVQLYDASGSLFDTVAVLGEEFSTASVTGYQTYTEMYKVLDSALGKATPTTAGTLGKRRIYTPTPYSLIIPQTYTFETTQGYAEQYAAGIFNGFKLTWSRKEASFSSSVIAGAINTGITPTASPSVIALEPIVPKTISLKMASTFAGLAAATPIRRGFEATLEYSNPYAFIFPMVNDNVGPDGITMNKPSSLFTLKLMKNAANMAILTDLRGATTLYFQIDTQGAIIDASPALYRTTKTTVACMVSKPFDAADDMGLKMVNWSFAPVPTSDADPFQITLTNTLA